MMSHNDRNYRKKIAFPPHVTLCDETMTRLPPDCTRSWGTLIPVLQLLIFNMTSDVMFPDKSLMSNVLLTNLMLTELLFSFSTFSSNFRTKLTQIHDFKVSFINLSL